MPIEEFTPAHPLSPEVSTLPDHTPDRENFYHTLADALPQIVWTAHPDGSPDYCNQRWLQFSGLSVEETRLHGWLLVIHPDDLQHCAERWKNSIARGEIYEVEARFKRAADGIYRWHLSRSVPVRDAGGQIVTWFGTCTDINDQKRLQEDYSKSEEQLSLAMEAAQLGFWDWDVASGRIVWSYHYARLMGYSSDEFEGTYQSFLECWSPEDRQTISQAIERSLKDDVPFDVESRVVWPDGSLHWISGKGRVFYNAKGRAMRMIGTIREVTERKTAEESLRESLNILRAVSQGTSDAIFVKDITGRYLLVNPTTASILGKKEQEIVGKDDTELLTPEDAALIMKTDRGVISSGKTQLVEEVFKMVGSTRTFLSTKSPYFDENGDIIGLIGIATDITERKETELALQASEKLYRDLAEAMPQIVFTATPQGMIDYFNQQWRLETGLATDKFLNDNWLEALHPDDRPNTIRRWRESMLTGIAFEIECRLKNFSNDCYRWYLSRALPVKDEAGQVVKWIGTTTNIDDWKRADEERRQLLEREQAARSEAEIANRTKDEFLATLSHELRTPLTAMLGWSKMLRMGRLDAEGERRAIEIIERNALVQTQLIEDILDVSRIITGKFRLDMQPVEMNLVIRAAMDVVAPAMEAKSIQLDWELSDDSVKIAGDASRLQQVVWNLLSNATKFTPEGGRIGIRLLRTASGVELIISDSGRGISPEFLPYVFDRFRQADAIMTRKHSGLGLGLAIVRHIVELHGGTVRAESAGEGQGASFIVYLPSRNTSKN